MTMDILELDKIFPAGKLDPQSFREGLEKIAWEQYQDKVVLVKGCGTMPIPAWAYMYAMVKLMPVAKAISYGEPHTATVIWRRA